MSTAHQSEEEIQEAIEHANKLLWLGPWAGEKTSKEDFWAGCNYYKNQGNNETEPVGSATAMHECDMCERISFCGAKQTQPVFRITPEIEAQIDAALKIKE